ncbi:MAG TPA: acyl-CoA thioesterase [Candidatus Deferrimicrobiaceae bacterium]
MIRPYFPPVDGAPAPLRLAISRQVRFEEVDPVAMVWHGRYPSFFEDARVALCEKYGIGYLDFHAHGIVTPIRMMHIDYVRPLRFRDVFSIEGILHWSESSRLNMEFVIRNGAGDVTTTGYSVQMMLDGDGNILLVPPPFYREFTDRWKEGAFA